MQMPFDGAVIGPCQDGITGEFAAVVADHDFWFAVLDHQPVQFHGHADAR
jgi:hypothetical protein